MGVRSMVGLLGISWLNLTIYCNSFLFLKGCSRGYVTVKMSNRYAENMQK